MVGDIIVHDDPPNILCVIFGTIQGITYAMESDRLKSIFYFILFPRALPLQSD